jgi:hypothetical protein
MDVIRQIYVTDPTSGEAATVNNGALDVNIQDQTTVAIDDTLCKVVTGPYTLASNTTAGGYTIVLTSATGLTVGDTIGMFQDSTNPRSYFGVIQSIATNTLTMDVPMPIVFTTALANLYEVNCDMAVDGSTTVQEFALQNNASIAVDIVRVMFLIETATSPGFDSEFGDLSALTRGCLLRVKKADGTYRNIGSGIKTNADLALYAYDLQLLTSFGANSDTGVWARLTFGSPGKHGVVLRIEQNEELQFLVQDDLTGLDKFRVMAQGHYTDET